MHEALEDKTSGNLSCSGLVYGICYFHMNFLQNNSTSQLLPQSSSNDILWMCII